MQRTLPHEKGIVFHLHTTALPAWFIWALETDAGVIEFRDYYNKQCSMPGIKTNMKKQIFKLLKS